MDESDQVGMLGDIFSLHLQSKGHDGKINPDCPFCKTFLMPEKREGPPLESYRFIILDISEDNNGQ